ncbi:hypothetical protein [Clostridium sp. DL1XJH146]
MNKKRFTLIGLIIGIVIIAIISVVIIPRFAGYNVKDSKETCISNRRSLFRTYLTGKVYGNSVNMQDIIDNKYFNNIGECPDEGEYTFTDNEEYGYTLSCSVHGEVHVNLVIRDDGTIPYSFVKDSTFTSTDDLFAIAIGNSNSHWKITETGLQNSTSDGEKLIYFDNYYDEYSIETTANLKDNKEGYGIIFETYVDDSNNDGNIGRSEDSGYIFEFAPGYSSDGALIFRERTADGEGESVGVLKDAKGRAIEINPLSFDEFKGQGQDFWTNEHTIKINVNEISPSQKQVDVYVDNVLVTGDYDIKIDALIGEQENKAGFRTWGTIEATIEDLNIKPLSN